MYEKNVYLIYIGPLYFRDKRDFVSGGAAAGVAGTVVPANSDSDVMFCLKSYQGLRIDRSRVY